MKNSIVDMLYLSACAVNGDKPDDLIIRQMELQKVYQMAKAHVLVALTYMGLEMSGIMENQEWIDTLSEEDKKCLLLWKDGTIKAIRKNMMLDAERKCFCEYCENEKIWYMPLKGSILKDIYPKPGMRQMADNDILIDEQGRSKVKQYFQTKGYSCEEYARGIHDVYQKKPVYNFEIHVALFAQGHNETFVNYYENVKKKLISDVKAGYGHHFSVEDFYIYFIAHAYKHYINAGTGIRTLLDIYVYQKKFRKNWNREYIDIELKKLDIFDFEKQTENIAFKLFEKSEKLDDEQFDEEYEQFLKYFMAGTYGSIDNLIEKKLRMIQKDKKKVSFFTKFRYLYRRIIPDKEFMLVWAGNRFAPFFKKYPFMIPFLVIYRWFAGGIGNLKHNLFEMNAVKRK